MNFNETSNVIAGVIAGVSASPDELANLSFDESRPREDPIEGSPVESLTRLFESDSTVAGIWECTPGRFAVSKRGTSSFMYFLAGRGTVTHTDGSVHEISPGGILITPDGFDGEWHITETVRKFYVITREPSA